MDGLIERSGTRPMLREDGSLELYESEAEFQRVAAGLGGARALRHRLPAMSTGDELAGCSPACRRRFVARHLRAGLEDGRRPEDSRQGGLAPTPRRRAPLSCKGDVGLVSRSRQGAIADSSPTAHDHGAAARRSPPAPGRICWRGSSATASRWRPSAATTRRCRRPPST